MPRKRTPRATHEGHRSRSYPRLRPASVPGRARLQGRGPRLAASAHPLSHPGTVGPVAVARWTDRSPARRSPQAGRDRRPTARARSWSSPASHLLRVFRDVLRTQLHGVDHDETAIRLFHGNDLKWDSVGVGTKEEDQVVAFGGWIEWADAVFHDVPRSLVSDRVFRRRAPEDDDHLMPSLCRTQRPCPELSLI